MKSLKAIAFYLPQFHPIAENDLWWGKGFTEWRNVMRARPQYPGHRQPRIPADLGFYDLRVPETRAAQAELARDAGIHGFCYYHYWFGGRRLLQRVFEDVLASRQPDFPFCLCWANENWSRRWDGGESEILIAQNHSPEDDRAFIRALFRAFEDPRYIRVNGRPLLIVYRSDILPDAKATTEIWREEAAKAGLGALYLCRAETFAPWNQAPDPALQGFDAAIEFPHHGTHAGPVGIPGDVRSYADAAWSLIAREDRGYRLHRGVMPKWDNTPRRMAHARIFHGATPELYKLWLALSAAREVRAAQDDDALVFINAWNEWAEGCHLEPDLEDGHAWLDATREGLRLGLRSCDPSVGDLNETVLEARWTAAAGPRRLAHPVADRAAVLSKIPFREFLRHWIGTG